MSPEVLREHRVVLRERRSMLMGHNIDAIFQKLGIDPALASMAAFEAAMIQPQEFPEQMVVRRVSQGISREALAAKLGYDLGTLLNWETGRTSPPIRRAADWAQSLGLELSLRLARAGQGVSQGRDELA